MTHHHHHGSCEHHQHSHCPCCAMEHAHGQEKDFPHELFDLADQAWMELIKDKIKAHLEKTSGNYLDQLAKTVADANKQRWINKKGVQKVSSEFKDKIYDLLFKE